MGSRTFVEGGENVYMAFLAQLGVIDILRDKLYEIAKSNFNFMGAKSDQYHIARKISPGESKEAYRAHFDSHLFTLVLPIKYQFQWRARVVESLITSRAFEAIQEMRLKICLESWVTKHSRLRRG